MTQRTEVEQDLLHDLESLYCETIQDCMRNLNKLEEFFMEEKLSDTRKLKLCAMDGIRNFLQINEEEK